MHSKRPVVLAIALLTLMPAGWSQAADPGGAQDWWLRVDGVWVEPGVQQNDGDFDVEGEAGVSVALERRISPRLGVELGALRTSSSFGLSSQVLDNLFFSTDRETDIDLFTLGLNVHLLPNSDTNLYIGPILGYFNYRDIIFRDTLITDQTIRTLSGEAEDDEDFALGAQIGADIPLGDSRWGLHLSARYFDSELEVAVGEDSVTYDFEPVIVGVGFSWSF